MVQAIENAAAAAGSLKERVITAYRWMLLARISEEKYASLYRGGKIHGSVFLGKGQEALSVSIAMNLQKGDIFAPLIRDQAGRLAFAESLLESTRAYLGSRQGVMRGRDGNVHRGRPRDGYFAMISHLGAMIPAVAGALLARRMKGIEGAVGVASIGEGGTSTGAFHEGVNLASVERLPLVIVIANNQYAYSTPTSKQFACRDLSDKAAGYGIEGLSCDGTDLLDCLKTVGEAVRRAREGGGAQMVFANLLRLAGHGEHDDAPYVDAALKRTALGRDCLERAECTLLENHWTAPKQITAWRAEAVRQVEEAVRIVQREPAPDPDAEDWCALSSRHLTDGFVPCRPHLLSGPCGPAPE